MTYLGQYPQHSAKVSEGYIDSIQSYSTKSYNCMAINTEMLQNTLVGNNRLLAWPLIDESKPQAFYDRYYDDIINIKFGQQSDERMR